MLTHYIGLPQWKLVTELFGRLTGGRLCQYIYFTQVNGNHTGSYTKPFTLRMRMNMFPSVGIHVFVSASEKPKGSVPHVVVLEAHRYSLFPHIIFERYS